MGTALLRFRSSAVFNSSQISSQISSAAPFFSCVQLFVEIALAFLLVPFSSAAFPCGPSTTFETTSSSTQSATLSRECCTSPFVHLHLDQTALRILCSICQHCPGKSFLRLYIIEYPNSHIESRMLYRCLCPPSPPSCYVGKTK